LTQPGSIPLIGLPTAEIPAGPRPARFGLNQSYVSALAAAGAAPLLIPLVDDEDRLRAIFDRLDGILFPGGADLAPSAYGEEAMPVSRVEPLRDRVELTLARWVAADGLPALGICRGQQLLNVALGGSLFQDLRVQGVTPVDHRLANGRARDALAHRVELDPASRLAHLLDEVSIDVNSAHHQAVKAVATGLQICGRSPDGVIEALEAPDRPFLITVQWHPEELARLPWVGRLFHGFVQACSATPKSRANPHLHGKPIDWL